jgi:C-terminal processing protease CtpA/Prc
MAASLALNSCGSNSGSGTIINAVVRDTTETFSLDEKQFLHHLFLTEYLWSDDVASNIDYAQYTDPQLMINDLRISPPDEWSFTMTQQEYEDYANQKTAGFGFGYTADFVVYLVRIDAPAYNKLFRGDKILEINGEAVSKSNIANASQNINVATTFTLLRGSNQLDVIVTPKEYTFKVTLGKVITQNTKNIGYLRYDSFVSSSINEFEEEFTKFKDVNIDELVIDLRYNGGGSVAVASTLLDNISNTHSGEKQVYLDWNGNYKSKNESYTFSDEVESNDLNMQRVIFLVTKDSASASELVISALKPYLGNTNVVTIGTNTHGKPVGMSGKTYGLNLNYYFLINFFVRNNAGDTTSFDGIPTTCIADDDLTHLMGDENETMLKTALYYIENGSCL